jgi:hypothetical protein
MSWHQVQSKYRYDTSKRVRSHFTLCKVNASFHDMRRSFGSNRASAGTSIYKIASWLGDTMLVLEEEGHHPVPRVGMLGVVIDDARHYFHGLPNNAVPTLSLA